VQSFSYPTPEYVQSVAFSPDGSTLVSGCSDDKIRVWDVATGVLRATLEGHKDRVNSVAFSPDGLTLASGSCDHTIRLWDVATGVLRLTLECCNRRVNSVAFSPDGLTLACGINFGKMKLWDVSTGEFIETPMEIGFVRSATFSPDSLTLAYDSGPTIVLIDVATGEVKTRFEGHTFGPPFNPFRDEVVIKESTSETGHKYRVTSVAFSPDGLTLVSGSEDKTIKLWNVATGDLKATFDGHTDGINSVAFSPDGMTLASGSGLDNHMWKGEDNTIKLWDVDTGELKATLEGHKRGIKSVAFSPDGLTLASGGEDCMIKLWEVASGELKATLEVPRNQSSYYDFPPVGWSTINEEEVTRMIEMLNELLEAKKKAK
jgi:WD40 repeat protein